MVNATRVVTRIEIHSQWNYDESARIKDVLTTAGKIIAEHQGAKVTRLKVVEKPGGRYRHPELVLSFTADQHR